MGFTLNAPGAWTAFIEVLMSYNSLLVSQMCEPSDIDTNAELHQQACNGDLAAKRALIEGNMPLVLSRVDGFLRSNPKLRYLYDELVSEGFLSLTGAVEAISKDSTIQKPSGYLVSSINNAFGQVVEDEVLVYYSRFTFYRSRGTGRKLPQHTTLSESEEFYRTDARFEMIDGADLVISCCQDDLDRQIITMRMDGHTVDEIAGVLDISQRKVFRILKRIRASIKRKQDELR